MSVGRSLDIHPRKSHRAFMQSAMTITIHAHWDDEAAGWWAESPELPGLVTEAPTIEALMERVKAVIPELLAANGAAYDEIPIELLADRQDRIRLPA